MTPRGDHVDHLLAQWRAERPDLDPSPMGVVGRVSRLARLLEAAIDARHAAHGLQPGWFDVLATLRRSGEPFELSAGDLSAATMLSTGGMTKRLDRLAGAGLVERHPSPDDRRSVRVRLTATGRRVIDAAVEDHLANERELLSALTREEQDRLAALLRTLLVDAEGRS